jgi:hypothetical protein
MTLSTQLKLLPTLKSSYITAKMLHHTATPVTPTINAKRIAFNNSKIADFLHKYAKKISQLQLTQLLQLSIMHKHLKICQGMSF